MIEKKKKKKKRFRQEFALSRYNKVPEWLVIICSWTGHLWVWPICSGL